jgi:hypothetical protein
MNIRDDDQVSAVALVVESEAQTAAAVADEADPAVETGADPTAGNGASPDSGLDPDEG